MSAPYNGGNPQPVEEMGRVLVAPGAPESPDSAVRLLTDGPAEQTVTAELAAPARGCGVDVAA